ncbi:MAG: isoleucine--tRNA ligase [Candidatus Acididesulfobacter diazotrophicus]|uniref:Isoleucine--tRNA ligase n=1 Tax=Candidatus Acididesulfobacter diazotrophicus TaxID=2597226 RepID=A0A519BK73_9DELT|nr:MAG: isoleucine--tRNA ligase [Candidatus Acididesulfobacter diazotrophicus]
MDYKNTLNLPSTDFPMKANLKSTEEKFLKEWDEIALYEKMTAKAKEKNFKTFILHDGPPYANGHIHLGTALNKILKDIIIRFKFMQGYYAPYIPGWDCHGLPIEHNVDKSLKNKDSISQVEKRKLCRKYAAEFVEIQKAEFKRLGSIGRYDNPYLTMNYSYEADTVRKMADFIKNGGLYRANKPIYWCSSCKTALAEAEVEYAEKTSPSIYVKFKIKSDLSDVVKLPEGKNVFAVIWTTTPWTLPANLAISLNPDFNYVFVEVNKNKEKEIYILEESLAEETLKKFGFKDDEFTILAEVNGKKLESKLAMHPFINRDSILILGQHVKKDTGTGLVHTAPGHGDEDYAVGLKYNLPAYAPVNNEGIFLNDVDFFAGMRVFDSNIHVIEKLKEIGALVLEEKIEHSYPHCWRCKKPLILRSTKQWFISMSINNLRENALKAVKENVKWIPKWGLDRISGMLEVRPDWCVSRQRSWGVPITAFYCKSCGEPLIDYDITMKIADEFEKYGADIWFEKDADYFLNETKIKKHIKCSKCGSEEFEKESDILDVWFDSGVSYFCVLKNDEDMKAIGFPADLYLEGSDQHRGWFHSSLLIAIGSQDGTPYKSVLTHGFVVDSSGRKMSKSLGNVIAPDEIINKYGADILRLWAASEDYKNDMRISNEILSRLSEGYRKIRNTIRFMLGNLFDFDETADAVKFEDLNDIDKYEIHNISLLAQNLSRHYSSYDFHLVYQNIYKFVTSFSSFYLDVSKDSLYVEAKNSFKRRSIQTVLHYGLNILIKYLGPILPFTSKEAWSYFNKKNKEKELAFEYFDEIDENFIDFELAERFEKLTEIRNIVLSSLEKARTEKVIGSSLEALVIIRAAEEDYKLLSEFKISELKEIFIVSALQIEKLDTNEENGEFISEAVVKLAPGQKCARCWTFSESVGTHNDYIDICGRCRDVLIDLK